MPVLLLRYILPLLIGFAIGWHLQGISADRTLLQVRLAAAQAVQAQAEKVKTTETTWRNHVAALEEQYDEATHALAERYAAARVRASASRIVLPKPAVTTSCSNQAATGDRLPAGVGGVEIAERDILTLMQAADENTQSLMACQAYIGIIRLKSHGQTQAIN